MEWGSSMLRSTSHKGCGYEFPCIRTNHSHTESREDIWVEPPNYPPCYPSIKLSLGVLDRYIATQHGSYESWCVESRL